MRESKHFAHTDSKATSAIMPVKKSYKYEPKLIFTTANIVLEKNCECFDCNKDITTTVSNLSKMPNHNWLTWATCRRTHI